MSAAIRLLEQTLADQEGKLGEVEKTERDDIEAGRRAQERVDAQRRHVEELRAALAVLEEDERKRLLPAD